MPTRCDAYILCSNDSLLQSQVDNLSHHHHRAVPHRSQNLSHVHPVDEEICSPIEFAISVRDFSLRFQPKMRGPLEACSQSATDNAIFGLLR